MTVVGPGASIINLKGGVARMLAYCTQSGIKANRGVHEQMTAIGEVRDHGPRGNEPAASIVQEMALHFTFPLGASLRCRALARP
jgi:hypothetical protein